MMWVQELFALFVWKGFFECKIRNTPCEYCECLKNAYSGAFGTESGKSWTVVPKSLNIGVLFVRMYNSHNWIGNVWKIFDTLLIFALRSILLLP